MRFTHRFVIHRVKLCGRGYFGVDRLKIWSLGRRETLERGKFRLGRLVIHLKKGGCVHCPDPIKVLSKQAGSGIENRYQTQGLLHVDKTSLNYTY